MSPQLPDSIVVGGGVIGLAAAVAIAERGLSVTVVNERRPGAASAAAAGMLAPSVERATGPAHAFGIAARDRYPEYVEFLADRTGLRVPLNRRGILQLALTEKGIKGLKKAALTGSNWLEAGEVRELEPSLAHGLGAVFNPHDGAVDNTMLLRALEMLAASHPRIRVLEGAATAIDSRTASCTVETRGGAKHETRFVVIAAGAWAGQLRGASYAVPVAPARGQLVLYPVCPLRHVVYGPRGYVVPRGDGTIGGSTMEKTGFDSRVTAAGIRKVRDAAAEICPALMQAGEPRVWAGLRPVTPDMLPILGADPAQPLIIYACGHSRNGVLMAALTGDIVADLVTGTPLSHDLSQFRPGRF